MQCLDLNVLKDSSASITFTNQDDDKTDITEFQIQKFNVPSVELPAKSISSNSHEIPFSAHKLIFSDLKVEFTLDENFMSYTQISNWIHRITVDGDAPSWRKNAIISILDGNKNVILTIEILNCLPVYLTDINFILNKSDIDPIKVTATFKNTGFIIDGQKITNKYL